MRLRKSHHESDKTFNLTSNTMMLPAEAARAFRGNKVALEAAEEKAMELADRWLQYFASSEGPGCPHVCRLDFITALSPEHYGCRPEVWTVELSECGSAMCGLHHAPRTVAVLNHCLAGGSSSCHSDRCPLLPLPRFRLEMPTSEVAAAPTPLRASGQQRGISRRGPGGAGPVNLDRHTMQIAQVQWKATAATDLHTSTGTSLVRRLLPGAVGGAAAALVVLLLQILFRRGKSSKQARLWAAAIRRLASRTKPR